jgi:hypothetical protein
MNDGVLALIWAIACFMGLIAVIVLLKGALLLIFGFGCLGLMFVFLYFATRYLVLRDRQR